MYVGSPLVYIRVLTHCTCLCEASGAVLQQIAALIDELRAEETQVQLNATKNLHRIGKWCNVAPLIPAKRIQNAFSLWFVIVRLSQVDS